MKKILFSHSYYYQLDAKQWKTGMPYPPLATITAASFMREKGYNVQLFDVGLRQSPKSIKPILEEGGFDFLVIYDDGFNYLTKMCLTVMREACFEMIDLAKTSHCKIIISSSDSTDHYQKLVTLKCLARYSISLDTISGDRELYLFPYIGFAHQLHL